MGGKKPPTNQVFLFLRTKILASWEVYLTASEIAPEIFNNLQKKELDRLPIASFFRGERLNLGGVEDSDDSELYLKSKWYDFEGPIF